MQLLGHTEDALCETVNHFYVMAVHVMPGENEKGGTFPAREEKFEAVTYAGHLPGYASGHNYHGLVFSINTIFVSKPLRGKIREYRRQRYDPAPYPVRLNQPPLALLSLTPFVYSVRVYLGQNKVEVI